MCVVRSQPKQKHLKKRKERINEDIRSSELRVLTDTGENLGVLPLKEALSLAREKGVDLIEVVPDAKPPIARLMDYGKYAYLESKKDKKARSGAKPTETKSIQIKVATGEHDLQLKAKKASEWLSEGHRIKIELYLRGRIKFKEEEFLKERLDRILKFITEPYKIAEDMKKSPKGMGLVIERAAKKTN